MPNVDDDLFDDISDSDVTDESPADESTDISDEQATAAARQWLDQAGYEVVPRGQTQQQPQAPQGPAMPEMDDYQRETYAKIAQAQAMANGEISAMVEEAANFIRSRGGELSIESRQQLAQSLQGHDLQVLSHYRANQQHFVYALSLYGSQQLGQGAPAGVRPQQGGNPIGSSSAPVNRGTGSFDSGQSILATAKSTEERQYMEHVKKDLMSRGRTAKEAEEMMRGAF